MTRKRQRETRVPSKIYHLSIFVNFKVTKNRKEVMPKGPKSIAWAKIQKVTHMNQLIVPIHPVSDILPCAASFLSVLRFLMAFLQGISAQPERRENSPASQAIPGEPKFEIPGRAEILGIALYRGEASFSQKSRFWGLEKEKNFARNSSSIVYRVSLG